MPEPDFPSVPGYEILEMIAAGSGGIVYRARARQFGRDVAVKVLRPGSEIDRFLREARITASLVHPGIVPLYVMSECADGRPFMAMKLVSGQPLDRIVRAGPPAADRARLIGAFAGACEALAYAHARGVVHRNPTPWKVMIDESGEAYLMGWGEARVLAEPEPPAPMTLVGPGALATGYMAPERVRGERGDPRTDVFGLGGLLCFILTGKPTHPSAAGIVDVVKRCLEGNFSDTFARLDACGADPHLIAVAKRCLAPTPADRYADAGEVAEAVAAYRHPVEEPPASSAPVAAEPAPRRAEPPAAPAAPASSRPRRTRAAVAVVVAAALLVLGAVLLRAR
jgi:serine/threonine protein kinase